MHAKLDSVARVRAERLKALSLSRSTPGALMNSQHKFKISQYPVLGWLDPTVATTAVPKLWKITHYVNGEFRQSYGPYDSEMAAEHSVNRLSAYFNRRDMACSH